MRLSCCIINAAERERLRGVRSISALKMRHLPSFRGSLLPVFLLTVIHVKITAPSEPSIYKIIYVPDGACRFDATWVRRKRRYGPYYIIEMRATYILCRCHLAGLPILSSNIVIFLVVLQQYYAQTIGAFFFR